MYFTLLLQTPVRRFAMAAVKILKERLKNKEPQLPHLYKGNSLPLAECRSLLERYGGGTVDLELLHDGIAVVTLNNPSKRNAISGKMMGAFLDVVEELETWSEGKGIILKGQDANFCSGGDLDMAREGTHESGFHMYALMDHILARFQALPLISIALIQGCGALGGGAEISVACDFRLMSSSCQGMGFVHGRMAILPAWGGTPRLVNAIGYRRALDVLSTCKVYPPAEAQRLELIDQIIPSETDDMKFAVDWLSERTCGSPSLIQARKTTALLATSADDISELANRLFAPFWGCPDNKKALSKAIKHRAR